MKACVHFVAFTTAVNRFILKKQNSCLIKKESLGCLLLCKGRKAKPYAVKIYCAGSKNTMRVNHD